MQYVRGKRRAAKRSICFVINPPRSLLSHTFRRGGDERTQGRRLNGEIFWGWKCDFLWFSCTGEVCEVWELLRVSKFRPSSEKCLFDQRPDRRSGQWSRMCRSINLALSSRQCLAVRILTPGVKRPCTRSLFNGWPL